MAELSKLELQITLNDEGLRDFEDQGVKVAETLNKSFSELDSTFMMLNRNASEFSRSLKLINGNKLTLSGSFLELESTFNNLNDDSVEFGRSLETLMKNGSTFGNSINQSTRDAGEEVKNLQEDVQESKSIIDRIFDSFVLRLAIVLITIFQVIKEVISGFKTIIAILKFLNDPIGTTNRVFNETKDAIIPLIDKSKKFVDVLRGYGKEIVTTIGATALFQAILTELSFIAGGLATITLPELIVLTALLGAGYLLITGKLDQYGKVAEDVFNNHVIPLFQNANKNAEELKQGINHANDALKNLENLPQELGPTPGPQQKLILEPIDPKILEEQKRQIEELENFKRRQNQETLELIRKNAAEQIEINKNIADKQSEFSKKATEDIKNNIEEQAQTIQEKGPIKLPDITNPRIITDPKELEQFNKEIEELRKSNDVINQQSSNLSLLNGALAMAGEASLKFAGGQDVMSDATNGVLTSVVSLREKGIDPLAGQTDELTDKMETASGQVEQVKGKFNTYGISLGDVNDLNKVFGVTQDQVNQSLDDGTVAFDSAGASAEEFGDTLDQVQTSGGFFEGIKQGFIDFVENVESNSELMADFFADTLSQMSQSFSDLFFNVLTGKFKDLADLAKQAFEAILRAFLDLVAAIVTKQIVISIAGVFGFGKESSASQGLDFAKQVFGIFEDAGSFFGTGSAAAGAGAAVAGAGGGAIASGAGLGGFAASGLSSVGTAGFGATSVFDVAAAGGGEEYRLAA
ncbi:MAG: hypothetical protein AB1598_13900 [Thermodesulfobacteriota bacterium]